MLTRDDTTRDSALVEAIRGDDLAAFDAVYDRYSKRLFGLCLQMLRDHAEAEDALQQTFLDAYNAILSDDSEIALSPWLYRIARNECLSRIRARREHAELKAEPAVRSLDTHAEEREELGEVLRDLKRLPDDQSVALTLSVLGDLSHAEIGDVLGCEPSKVKSLVFRAHRALAASREARATDCAEVRELLDELRGGALRRIEIRDHLRDCPGCREYRENSKRVRAPAAAALLPFGPFAAKKAALAGAIALVIGAPVATNVVPKVVGGGSAPAAEASASDLHGGDGGALTASRNGAGPGNRGGDREPGPRSTDGVASEAPVSEPELASSASRPKPATDREENAPSDSGAASGDGHDGTVGYVAQGISDGLGQAVGSDSSAGSSSPPAAADSQPAIADALKQPVPAE